MEIVASATAAVVIICVILLSLVQGHLRKSQRSICDFFRPHSQYFIFKRSCGKKRKHDGPLEQGYQPYEMIRPLGQQHAETGFDKGFDDIAVSEA